MNRLPLAAQLAQHCSKGEEILLDCGICWYQGILEMVWENGCILYETRKGGELWAIDLDAIAAVMVRDDRG